VHNNRRLKKTMENVVDYSTACGLREARPHPVDHPPRTSELGEGAAGMVLTATQQASRTKIVHDGIHFIMPHLLLLLARQKSAERAIMISPVRPAVRPSDCPSICYTGGSIKNGWRRLCNFHRIVAPYL